MKTFRKKTSFCSIALAFVVLIAAGGVCQGWWPYAGSCSGWFPGWFPRWSDLERLPHYALFPPVYYSHPVPRTYGYSPFASLPELTAILEVHRVEPLVVRNPYAAPATTVEPPEKRPSGGPLIVRNSFVEQSAHVASSRSVAEFAENSGRVPTTPTSGDFGYERTTR